MRADASSPRERPRRSRAPPTRRPDVTSATWREPAAGRMTRRQADLSLLLATFLWGTSFVAVKTALPYATPFAFITVRFGIAPLALAPRTRFPPYPPRPALHGAP